MTQRLLTTSKVCGGRGNYDNYEGGKLDFCEGGKGEGFWGKVRGKEMSEIEMSEIETLRKE